MAEDESPDLNSNTSEKEKYTLVHNLFGALFLGFFLFISTVVSLLGIFSVILFVMIPLEQWAIEFGVSYAILFEIPIIVLLILLILVAVLVVGRVNRGGVESIWEISLPKNRRWMIAQGLLVYVLGAITQISLYSYQIWMEASLESWSEQFPGSLGDFMVGMVTGPVSLIAFLLTGIIGYLIAVKLLIFRNA